MSQQNSEVEHMEMTGNSDSQSGNDQEQHKDMKGSMLRKVIAGCYVVVVWAFAIALAIVVGVSKENGGGDEDEAEPEGE